MTPEHTRRGVLKGALGLTCATCGASAMSSSAEPVAAESSGSLAAEWNELAVEGYPFSIRYRSGYKSDAEQVREWAIFAHGSVQEAYSHELSDPITFDVYPDEEWTDSHGTMVYSHDSRSASMVAPSEYNGGYSDKAMYYRHGVTHEYAHAAQKNALSFHTHANWITEGFAEAVSVYYTDDEIYNSYHTGHSRAREIREDVKRGYGYVLGVNEYVYRGSMQLLKFMFEEYGSQAVGEVFEQDAENIVEAMEMRLNITPLDLEAAWLTYAQREIGGDYTEEIERLGGTVPAFLSLDSPSAFDPGSVRVRKVTYADDSYVVVAYDENMEALGTSETFAAGEQQTDVDIAFDRELGQPHRVTVRLHRADQSESGYGEAVTVDGDRIEETVLYDTSTAGLAFAASPTPDDTTVTLDVFVSEEYDTADGDVMLRVMDGDSTRYQDRIDADSKNLSPGANIIDLEIGLDESYDAVPLSDGQTITANLIDDAGGNTMASVTRTVATDETTHASGLTQAKFDAVAGADGTLDRSDVLLASGAYIGNKPVDGVTLDRSDVLNLVEYYIR